MTVTTKLRVKLYFEVLIDVRFTVIQVMFSIFKSSTYLSDFASKANKANFAEQKKERNLERNSI